MRRQILGLLCLLPTTPALAAGFGLREHSTEAMGEAYAGAAATASDAGFLSYNPAAAAGTQGGDFALSAVSIMPGSSANYTTALTAAGTPTGGNAKPNDFIRNAIIPDIAIRQRLDDRWSVGLSVSVPWGLSTRYPDGWSGRYHALGSKLATINIAPVVAYDLAPGFTIAGGLQAQYAKGTLSSAVDIGTLGALSSIPGSVPGGMDGSSTISASGWGYGYVLGARAELDDGWTLGVSYRSIVHHTLSGTWSFSLDNFGLGAAIRSATTLLSNTSAKAKLATPAELGLGLRKQFMERWTLLATADWTDWSSFKNLTAVAGNPVQPNDVTITNWKSSWMMSLGTEYAASDDLTLRLGVALDQTPVPSATLAPRIPDADRTWVAAGVTWRATPDMDLKLSFGHLFNDTRTLDQSGTAPGNALRGTLLGTTKSDVDVLGLAVAYRWQ
ncbi:MAG: outer membrane protein transport protein [Alphaproteobacteria bacterium]|nr:outer membrane protein transport protein [Alphaproteobacteria bacterium]